MFRDKLKGLIKKDNNEGEGNDKRKIENIVFFIVLLVVTIVIINTIWNVNKQTTKQENNVNTKQLALQEQEKNNIELNTAEELEKKLENILSKIEGVGNVKVCIN